MSKVMEIDTAQAVCGARGRNCTFDQREEERNPDQPHYYPGI